jgi:putative ABC transport system ATP-binding protein
MHLLAELRQSGKTILVATHDPRMLNFATHTIYLLDGRQVSETQYQNSIQQTS